MSRDINDINVRWVLEQCMFSYILVSIINVIYIYIISVLLLSGIYIHVTINLLYII